MKKGKWIGIAVVTVGLLTGCVDNMPEMTDEQSALVAEYAADMLLKYSPNYNYKVVDEEELIEELMEETTMEETTMEETSEEQTTEEMTQQEIESEEMQETEVSNERNMVDAAEVDFAEMFGIDGVEIRYDSLAVCKAYPKDEIGTGFSVSADAGNSLIVIHFVIENTSEDVVNCDLFEKDFVISGNLNDGNYKKISSSLLVNDFTTYMEEIPVGESRDVVIIAETEEISEDEIDSYILRMSTDDATITTKLK